MEKKKVIIIGASSGIGKELAIIFSTNGYEVGITGRRKNLLEELAGQLPTKSYISSFDVRHTASASIAFSVLLNEMGKVNMIIINAGTGSLNPTLDASIETDTAETNVLGFTALADMAYKYFENNGGGHLAAVSSIAGLFPNRFSPAYGASKAYITFYLKSLWNKSLKEKAGIIVSDIIPGFVRTQMAQGENLFWVATPQKAAAQIYQGLLNRKRKIYITRRWRFVALLIKALPEFVLIRI